MNTNFIQKFIDENVKGINTFIKEEIPEGFTEKIGSVLTQLNDIKKELINTCQCYGEMIPSLLMTGVMPIDSDYSSYIDTNNYKQYIMDISSDVGNTILSSISNVLQYRNYISDSVDAGLSIVSSDGLAFVLVPYTTSFYIDGVEYISDIITNSSDTVRDVTDVFLAHKVSDGSFILNYGVRDILNDLSIPYPTPPEINDIESGIKVSMENLGFEYNDDYSIHYNLYRYIQLLDIKPTGLGVDDYLVDIIKALSNDSYVPSDNSMISHVVDLSVLSFPHITRVNRLTYLGDILSDLVKADTINNVMLQATELLVNGQFKVDTFTDAVSEIADNFSSEVSQIINGIKTSFNSGGVLGCIKYIVNILSSPLKAYFNVEDQILEFTDNSKLVPQVYFSGLIFKVATTVTSIVGSIVEQIHPIVGAVIQIVAQIGDWIQQALTYDYDVDTLAQVNQSLVNIVLPYSHIALWQTTVSADVADQYILDYINIVGTFYIEIVGGILLIGPGVRNDQYRLEFHPCVCQYDRKVLGLSYGKYSNTNLTGDYDIYFVTSPNNAVNISKSKLKLLWESRKPLEVYTATSGTTLNAYSDLILRGSFLESSALFLIYLGLNTSAQDNFTVSDVTNYIIGGIQHRSGDTDVYYKFMNTIQNDRILAYLRSSSLHILLAGCMPQAYMGLDNVDFENSNALPTWSALIEYVTHASQGTQSPFTSMQLHGPTGSFMQSGNDYLPIDFENVVVTLNLINAGGWSTTQIIRMKDYYNFPKTLASNVLWSYKIPEYDRATYLLSIAGFILGVGVLLTATVVTTLAVRHVIRNERMRYEFALKEAYDKAMKDPTSANMNAYQKLSFEANLFSFITDGSMYSRTSFWDRSGSKSRTTISTVLTKAVSGLFSKKALQKSSNEIQNGDTNDITQLSSVATKLNGIYRSVTGNSF